MDILHVKRVYKSYANHTALHNVSLRVPQKSIFGLLGPNGAGKTSLIRIINQITAPDKGEILFEKEPLSPKHISQIGYLPEERGLYKKMGVGEQALYLAQLKGMSKQEATIKLKQWFQKFEIENWWDKKVEELSKGMAQKVQFITTVLHEPKLLILDEPFSGFDPINTNLIKKEILELREKGSTIIFSTHNMASVEEICDHIALINKSKKILDGKVKDIKEAYRSNSYEIVFEGNMIAFSNALWTSFEIISTHIDNGRNYVKVKGTDNRISVNTLLATIINDVRIISVNELTPSMNDIFIQKVGEANPEDLSEE
ncbi:MAG TPA: ATP-binding cassette domain-containing protein [Vicingus sp.]|nr:ABC transporter ATP-binding protein [Flavobacteriales bacterium]MBV6483763.1 Vitamin B12 import ATP-binding protein BtuD [Flavobacteriales bacterium]HRN42588.1 ATP-binding cassette domain-containing protein [Vicingus sp.]